MPKTVIFVEKAKAAKSIAKALNAGKFNIVENLSKQKLGMLGYWKFNWNGAETYIIYGSGHLAGLCEAKEYGEQYEKWSLDQFPCLPEKYITKPLKHSKKHFDLAKKMFKDADLIISATDSDREGQVVFDNVYKTLKCNKPWKRCWLPSDLTIPKIRQAFNSLESPLVHYPLTLAGNARAIADWTIGINLTVAATLKFGGSKQVMNVGRVQTAVLNLIATRTRNIENFTSLPFWSLSISLKKEDRVFNASLVKPEKFTDKQEAETIFSALSSPTAAVKSIEQKQRTLKKPVLFNTTDLQTAINRKYGYEVSEIADIMESLYNSGYITYPRTGASAISEAMENEVRTIIHKLYNTQEYAFCAVPDDSWAEFTSQHFNDKAIEKTGESHTAIIPTLQIPDFSKLSQKEMNVYDVIARSVLLLPFQDVKISDTTVIFDVNGYDFKATGSTVFNENTSWYRIEKRQTKDELPYLSEGEQLNYSKKINEGKTKPEPYFTEGSLLKAMQYANRLIDDNELSSFMKAQNCGLGTGGTRPGIIKNLKQNNLIKTEKGHLVPTFKGYWLIDHIPDELRMIKEVETTGKWEQMLNEIAVSKTKDEAVALTMKFLAAVKQATIKYFAMLANSKDDLYADTDNASQFSEGNYLCPKCGKPLRKMEWGYGCSGYSQGCKFTLGKVRNKKLTNKQIADLLTKGKTSKITFKAKDGSSYKGYLFINEQGDIKFSFD